MVKSDKEPQAGCRVKHWKHYKAPWGMRRVRSVSGIQSTFPLYNTGCSPVKPCRCVRKWGSLHQGRLLEEAVTHYKFLPSGRCSLLKELVEVFINFKPNKSEERVLWTSGEDSLCEIYGIKNFGQQRYSADDTTVCRNMLPT